MTGLRFLILVLFIPSVGFSFELKTVPEISSTAYLKWKQSDTPVRVSLERSGSADLPLSQVENALRDALNSWQSVSNQNMRLQYDGTVHIQGSSTDRINSIQWIENGWDYSSHAIAVTSYSYYLEDPPTLVDADIFMNGENYRWTINGAHSGRVDAQQTLIHELGHLLGIAHSGVLKAQMFPFLSRTPNHKLSKDDRHALRYLYGSQNSFFSLITPVQRVRYAKDLSGNGLPLPIFRWVPGSQSNYVIEFSGTSNFSRKIQISAGPDPFYALTPSMEKNLSKLSPTGRVFWRVRSGGSVTATRTFRFIAS
jgi:hypothetical protein